jgi:hypothetical protein
MPSKCSRCGFQTDSEIKKCPQCGASIRKTLLPRKYEVLKAVLIFFACIVAFFSVYTFIHGGKLKPAATQQDISQEAVSAAQEFVSRKLIVRSTARFPHSSQARVAWEADNQYTINSYVEAQNRAGEMLKKNYECVLRYEPEKKRWHLVRVTIEK